MDGIPGAHSVLAPLNAVHLVINDHLDSSTVQLIEVPEDNLLDHPPALAEVDGIPGSQPLLAVPLACTQGDLAVASKSSLPHAEAID